MQSLTWRPFPPPGYALPSMMLGVHRHPYFYSTKHRGDIEASLSSMDSDLEAFSRNPTNDSFAAMPFQATANTNDLKQRFLSY